MTSWRRWAVSSPATSASISPPASPRRPHGSSCGQIPDHRPLTGWGFVKDLATRTEATPATARWDTGTVLTTIGDLAGRSLLDRILTQLPPGYALLFGRAELTQQSASTSIRTPVSASVGLVT